MARGSPADALSQSALGALPAEGLIEPASFGFCGVVTHRKEPPLRQHYDVQAVLRHLNAAIGKLFHLRIPSLLMRARAQATVRVWKNRLEHQAHSRSNFRDGCGLPVVTEVGL